MISNASFLRRPTSALNACGHASTAVYVAVVCALQPDSLESIASVLHRLIVEFSSVVSFWGFALFFFSATSAFASGFHERMNSATGPCFFGGMRFIVLSVLIYWLTIDGSTSRWAASFALNPRVALPLFTKRIKAALEPASSVPSSSASC